MEQVAQEAKIAKATLYAYFPHKEALFRAVAIQLCETLGTAALQELSGDGALDVKISKALYAKDQLVFQWVRGSPHAQELFAAKNALARDQFEALDKRLIDAITKLLKVAGHTLPKAKQLARITFDASLGLANRSSSARQLQVDLDLLVHCLIRTHL